MKPSFILWKLLSNKANSSLSGELEPYLMGIARNLWYQGAKENAKSLYPMSYPTRPPMISR